MIGAGARWRRPGAALAGVLLAGLLVSCGSDSRPDTSYLLPWSGGSSFAVPEGTSVVAARGGTVGLAVGSWPADHCGGLTPVADQPPGYLVSDSMGNQTNLVRIDHGDGTSALYLHLSEVDPQILTKARTGEPVVRGERLGLSGRTGLTGCVPHLHFQVEQTVRADWYTTSLPISFADPDVLAQDPNGVPAEGGTYVSGNATS